MSSLMDSRPSDLTLHFRFSECLVYRIDNFYVLLILFQINVSFKCKDVEFKDPLTTVNLWI